MLKRKVYDELTAWKESRKRGETEKCLLVKGARQVGKSYIIREFGRKEYKSFIEIDFYKRPDLKAVFDGTLVAEEVYKKLSAHLPGVELIEGNTLIFLDEIQRCGGARTALKFLATEKRFDVIASGSLLGLAYGEDADGEVEAPASVPVGYESIIEMYSLDFEEFLWAIGYGENAIGALRSYYEGGESIPTGINELYESLFREYMVVGGMPEVVADYAGHKDFNRVHRIQSAILAEYQDDIAKHAKGKEKHYVRMCYDAVPKQLAKELKKFQYSTVESGQTRRKFGGSVQWLKDSNLVNVCNNVREPFIPLIAGACDDQFKLYINDTGLLSCMYGYDAKLAILNNTIKGNARGGLYENIIAECLVKRGYKLYYYKPDSEHELEFLIEKQGEVVPIEVKAGNSATVSLNRFIEKYNPPLAIKLISGGNGTIGVRLTLPHYMVMFI